MIEVELQFFQSLDAKLHARLDSIETTLHAKVDAALGGIKHLIQENPMSALTDAIRSEIATVSSDVDQLIAAAKRDDDSAVRDIQSDLDALKTKVAAALAPTASASPIPGVDPVAEVPAV